jgi:type IV pilus assembly protein PilY1
VLFILDNGANFDATASGAGCSSYDRHGHAPSMGSSKSAGMLQCALVDAINSLPDGSVNIGLMVSNGNNYGTDTRAGTDKAYHEPCNSSGQRRLPAAQADPDDVGQPDVRPANKASFIEFIKTWNAQGNNSDANNFSVKVELGRHRHGHAGSLGLLQRQDRHVGHQLRHVAAGCRLPAQLHHLHRQHRQVAPGESPSPAQTAAPAITRWPTSRVNASTAQKAKISTTVTFDQSTCGVTSMVAGTAPATGRNWADEWARLMFQQDGGTNARTARRTSSPTPSASRQPTCTKADYPALLSSMAKYGGGKYFQTSDAAGPGRRHPQDPERGAGGQQRVLVGQLAGVGERAGHLPEPDLPGHVPARWRRPAALDGQPEAIPAGPQERQPGDGRQERQLAAHQFGRVPASCRRRRSASGPARTPPSRPTTRRPAASSRTRRWARRPAAFDSPDGEVVEKGGVAQQLRKENLKATFTGAMASQHQSAAPVHVLPQRRQLHNDLTNGRRQRVLDGQHRHRHGNAFGDSTDGPHLVHRAHRHHGDGDDAGNHGFTTAR